MKLLTSAAVSLLLMSLASVSYGQVETINYSDGAFMWVKSGMDSVMDKELIPLPTGRFIPVNGEMANATDKAP